MWGPLFLEEGLVVPAKIVQNLKGYQVDNIRFLHQQCIVKKQNVVLNYANKMNPAQEISALLGVLELPCPSLFITQKTVLSKWHQELNKCNLDVMTPDELIKNVDEDSESNNPNAVILTHDQIRHVKKLPVDEWFFLVFDDIDKLISSRYIKNIPAQHYIAITLHNFVVDTNPSMLWSIIKLINPKFSEEKDSFIKFDEERRDNLLDLFPDFWRRVTWFLTGEESLEDDDHKEIEMVNPSKQNVIPLKKTKKSRSKRSLEQLQKNKRFSRQKLEEINAAKSISFSSDEPKTCNKINHFSTKTFKISEHKQITHLYKRTEQKNNFEFLETTSTAFSESVQEQNVDMRSNSVPEDNSKEENKSLKNTSPSKEEKTLKNTSQSNEKNTLKNTSPSYENDILNSLLFVDDMVIKVDKIYEEKMEHEFVESNCDKYMKSYAELNVISSQKLTQSSTEAIISFSKNYDSNFILDSLVDSPKENNTHSFEGATCSILDSLL